MKDFQVRRLSRRVVRGYSSGHQPAKLSKGQIRGQRSHLRAHAVAAGILLLVFAVIEWQVEHSAWGGYFQRLAFRLLQKANTAGAGEPLPVVVVDISNHPEFRVDASGYTARRPLLQLVENLSRYDPKCIAVDIDLSPDEVGTFPPQTVELLERFLQLKGSLGQGIPVFLGIHRSQGWKPELWLFGEKYAHLAASISRPKGAVDKMIYEFQFPGTYRTLPGLSYAAASAFRGQPKLLPPLLRAVTERVSTRIPSRELPDFKVRDFFVNYTALHRLIQERVLDPTSEGLARIDDEWKIKYGRSRFRGSIVLIGDGTPGTAADTATFPGEPEPLPGIYAHAAATYTLIHAPLFEMKSVPAFALSMAVSLVATGFGFWLVWKYSASVFVTRIPLIVGGGVISLLIVWGVGWGIMSKYHVLWLGVLTVSGFVVVHGRCEVLIEGINWHRMGFVWQEFVKGLVTSPSHEPKEERK